MVLQVKGIGKIKDSTIKMDGITVIAGENNTGKSTFGKTLYCMFNAFRNFNMTVLNERIDTIKRTIINSLPFDDFDEENLSRQALEQINNMKDSFSADLFKEIILSSIGNVSESDMKMLDDIMNISLDEIKSYINISDYDIKKSIINRYFRSEFANQINHINRPNQKSDVSLSIKGKKINAVFSVNECIDFEDDVGIIHNAIYIDTPFILDDIGVRRVYYHFGVNRLNRNYHRDDLYYKLQNDSKSTVITEAVIKQKLNNILNIINTMTDGDFIKSRNTLVFSDHSIKQPLALQNLSAGMKIFLIIKRLLEQNEIKEKGVLIFDEPEIHLHPSWQIKFAEILVLLQKEFQLSILLTTHSPYFLHAIEVFSEKHNITKEIKFYLARNNGDTSDILDVSNNIDEVYRQLAEPFQKLDDIIYQES